MKEYFVYMMASQSGTLYIGVTNDLQRRVTEHRFEVNPGFSQKYKSKKLVYFEQFPTIDQAIDWEKRLKKWRREKKVKLIEATNPFWEDLAQF